MDELVKQLRFCAATDVSESPYPCDGCSYDNPNDYGLGNAWNVLGCSARMMLQAADAIEELSSFREHITDGHFYCMRDGVLYEAKVEPPKGKVFQLPPMVFVEEGE